MVRAAPAAVAEAPGLAVAVAHPVRDSMGAAVAARDTLAAVAVAIIVTVAVAADSFRVRWLAP